MAGLGVALLVAAKGAWRLGIVDSVATASFAATSSSLPELCFLLADLLLEVRNDRLNSLANLLDLQRSRIRGRAYAETLVAEAFRRHMAFNASCGRSTTPSQADGKRAETRCLVRSKGTR